MSKYILFVFFMVLAVEGYSQNKLDTKVNAIGISIPVIWNNSEATFYSGNKSSGKSSSYGIGLNYSRTIYKDFFAIVGVGYFKQNFKIARPFKFNDPTSLLFTTKSYLYENLEFLIGVGYGKKITQKTSVRGAAAFNLLNSFEQKYVPQYLSNSSFQNSQNNSKSLIIGNYLTLAVGVEEKVAKKIFLAIDLLVPISTHWQDDVIFYEYSNYPNTQQIAKTKSSIGTSISCNYHF